MSAAGNLKRAGAGRPKGSKNKVSKTIKAAFERAFTTLQRDPKARLAVWARANPTDFYKLASKLIPQEVKSEVNFINADVTMFTDDELAVIAAGQATNELITRLAASARSSSSSRA